MMRSPMLLALLAAPALLAGCQSKETVRKTDTVTTPDGSATTTTTSTTTTTKNEPAH